MPGRGTKDTPQECQRQRRASTVSLPPPRTVEQPQACSIIWQSFMAAPWQRQITCRLLDQRDGKRSPPEYQRQRRACTLTHRHFAPWSSRKLPQSFGRASWRPRYNGKAPTGAWPWHQGLSTRVPEAETSKHRESASAPPCESASARRHGAAASLLDQSEEPHGGSVAKAQHQAP